MVWVTALLSAAYVQPSARLFALPYVPQLVPSPRSRIWKALAPADADPAAPPTDEAAAKAAWLAKLDAPSWGSKASASGASSTGAAVVTAVDVDPPYLPVVDANGDAINFDESPPEFDPDATAAAAAAVVEDLLISSVMPLAAPLTEEVDVPLLDTPVGPVDVLTLTLPPGVELPLPVSPPATEECPTEEVPRPSAEEEEEVEEDEEDERIPLFEVTLPDLPEPSEEEAVAQAEEPTVLDLSPLPSLTELAAFCLPTLGIWLSSPLLSLIDTSVVGISCAESQLAALAPSTKLCDYVAFFCTVIAAATTNLAAERFARDEPTQAKRIVGGALMVSVLLGVAIAVLLGLGARALMQAMLGANPSMAVLTAATDYTAIRALGYPAALLTMTLQAAFIATKDATTPLLAVPVTALVNLGGDLALVRSLGAAGTAWATVASLYVNAAVLMVMWAKKVRSYPGENVVLTWPNRAEAAALFSFAAPMMVALVARVYMGLSVTLSAVACGTVALATNQVIESLYWLFCPFGDAVSLCMQAYLPPLLISGRSLAKRMQALALRAAAGLGVIASLAAAALPLFAPYLFTTSKAIVAEMARSAPMLGYTLFFYILSCVAEGMLVARKKLRFLAVAHMGNTALLVAALAWLRKVPSAGLPQIWTSIAVINAIRCVEFGWRLVKADEEDLRDQWAASLWPEPEEEKRSMRWRFVQGISKRRGGKRRVDEIVPDIASEFPELLM